MSERSSLDLVDEFLIEVLPTSDPDELLAYGDTHPWELSGNRQWRSPATVQFAQSLPDELYRSIGALVERRPDTGIRAYDGADGSLSWLRHMPAAAHLSIELAHAERFDPLEDVPQLLTLSLGGTLGASGSLGVLTKLEKLQELALEGHAKGFDAVAALPQLRSLSLYASRVPSLEPLRGAVRLELLNLSFGRVRDFSAIANLPSLRGVAIWQTKGMTAGNLAGIGELPALEALDLGAMRTVESLDFLRGRAAGSLRYLLLEGMAGLTDWNAVEHLSVLEELGVWGKAPIEADVGPLLAAPRLDVLVFEQTVREEQAVRLTKDFRGSHLAVNKHERLRSDGDIRVGWRSGTVDMLRTSVHCRQWVG
ncbi:hypothetical protein [Amnibacterium kyonggiense]|uniref:Leucine rich repeat (LRR) protein n=1 Tax=Amnibacterium kyonggiense TaxID=595671 RepID=A0A4V3EB63_9MICO|nr:hypothetical protein [Amnibacterium kyonggiense]TDS80354.1 hypothetical protein CLV52_0912 [Amnibacterium kyonggiense]